jgi:hypothetical protein
MRSPCALAAVRLLARTALVAASRSIAAAWFARQNVFSGCSTRCRGRLSRPAPPRSSSREIWFSVRVGDDAAAYPIRQMAYHHLVNHRIGRTPAVVTY